MSFSSLLITSNLNSTNQFATNFALHLLNADQTTDENNQLFALVSPKDGTRISKSLKPFLDAGQFTILFGTSNSRKLVKRAVEENKIRTVFVLLDDENKDCDEENTRDQKSHSIASKTRSLLTSLCSLLDCLRQSNDVRPSIVVLFHSFDTVQEEFLPQSGINHQILPTVQCTSEKSARFSSIHAICHAFAVSYKMNIQIGLVNETNELVENKHVFDEFASLASQKSEEKAQISFFRVGKIIGDDEFFSINRLLLFSNIKLDEQQKHQAIKDLSSLNNSFVLDENNFVWSKALPGRDNDELIEEEIFDNKPSHLVFFHEERGLFL